MAKYSTYICRSCKHEYYTGFLNEKCCKQHCPKCWGKFSQLFNLIGTIIKVMILPVIAVVLLRSSLPPIYERLYKSAVAALDITTLYTYSKDAYLESIIWGRQEIRYFTITQQTPYYSSILSKTKIETAEPLGILSANTVVELRNIIRRGENVWVPAFFYIGAKPQQAFALFPRDWEENASPYDWNARIKSIRTEYETVVKTNFDLMQVAPADEKEYQERYNDYYKVRDISGDNYSYAPKTDKSKIDSIHSYYLNMNNINMVILQADNEWMRPELVIDKTEVEE